MVLERMEMENFKCFYGHHEVVFGARMNCITGPNGSGKSNILEAICFAFGESRCARLRVASMKELHSTPRGSSSTQEPTTQITLHLRTRQNEPLTLSASLCARTGHRTFKLNNRITPIKHVKRHLRLQCGINTDVSLWMIQQNLVHKMPSRTPVELAGYLCESGGTKLFFEYREEAQVAIEGFKLSVQTIEKNIRHLSDVVRRDLAVLELFREQQENDREITSLSKMVELMNRKILCAKLDELKSKVSEIEQSEITVETNLSAARADVFRYEREADMLRERLDRAKLVHIDYDALQLELIRVRTQHEEKSSRIVRLLREKKENQSTLERLEQELHVALESKIANEKALYEVTARILSMEALHQLFVEAVDRCWSKQDLDQEITRRMQLVEHEDVQQTAEVVGHKLASVERHQAACRAKQDNLNALQKDLSARISKREGVIRQLRAQCANWTESRLGREIKNVQQDLDQSEVRLRALQVHLPKLHVPIQGEGDHGLLMDLFRVRNPVEQETKQWIGPLSLILQKSLHTRICIDMTVAKRILAVNRNQYSFSIWPVEDLQIQPRKLDRCIAAIQKEHGQSNVVDPLELLSVVDTLPRDVRDAALKCLRKAISSWLLVSTDEIGQAVLRKYGLSSVSMNLNMHSPGMLSGGFNGENKTFQAFVQLPTAHDRRSLLEKQLSDLLAVKAKLRSLTATEEQQERLMRQRSEYLQEGEEVRLELTQQDHKHELLMQKQHALRNVSVRKRVLKQDLETYQKANSTALSTQLHDPLDIVFQGQRLEELRDQANQAATLNAEIELQSAMLQSRVEQLTLDLRENDALIESCRRDEIVLQSEVQSLSTQSDVLVAKLNEESEDQSSLALAEEEIRALSTKARSLEDQADLLMAEKHQLQTQLDQVEEAVTEARGGGEFMAEEDTDTDSSVQQLEADRARVKKELSACFVKQKVIKQELSSVHHVVEEAVLFKQRRLARFETQVQNLQTAISHLEEGIGSTQQRSVQANKVAFSHVRRCLRDIFAHVVPSKRVDLCGDETNIEAGVTFNIASAAGDSSAKASNDATKELSGGQLAMLGLAYVFALARYSASPLYVLDEVDAALDEHNQRIVADLVLENFSSSQVICISHHEVFHARASQLIQVQKQEATSSVTTRTLRQGRR